MSILIFIDRTSSVVFKAPARSLNRAVNTLHLSYKNQSVNAV